MVYLCLGCLTWWGIVVNMHYVLKEHVGSGALGVGYIEEDSEGYTKWRK